MATKPSKTPTHVHFASPELWLRVDGDEELHSATVFGWRVSEHFEPNRYFFGGIAFGSYRVHLDYEVSSEEDAGTAYIAGCHYARALDRAWSYATGMPLSGRGYDLFLSPSNPPSEWSSNASEALPADDWETLQSRVSYVSRHRVVPWFPLRSALRVMEALRDMDELSAQISVFHGAAMTAIGDDLPFLMFAQALEAADPFLRGGTALEIPTSVCSLLKQSVKWVYMIANQRRETRHSIDKGASVALKPGMTDQEKLDFLHDANLLVHWLMVHRLGVPLVLNENGRTIVAT